MRLAVGLGLAFALGVGCGGGNGGVSGGGGSSAAGNGGQAGASAAGGQGGTVACAPGTDYDATSCFNGVVTYQTFCPPTFQTVGTCPNGCKRSGGFGNVGLSLCNTASPDGGCDGDCSDGSNDSSD
jgi:hypothetical protein